MPDEQQPDLPPLPAIPPWPKLRVFLLGALWAILMSLTPAVVIIYDWLQRLDDPIDWTMVWHLAAFNAAGATIAYWRKYKALLSPPPPQSNGK